MQSGFKKGDKVLFGRKNGEKTRATIIRVNRKTVTVRQDESRGTMKAHPVGTEWKVGFGLLTLDPTGGVPEAEVQSAMNEQKEAKAGDQDFLGHRIVEIRPMTSAEKLAEGWDYGYATALVLDNGCILYASQDEEGNGPGALFGVRNGKHFGIHAGQSVKA